jgi:tRNA U34 2-thiouridine synthase MnmA/TrmU
MSTSQQRKAVALISGGLDSMLAARMMLDQGVHVEGINYYTGFCVEGHTHAIRNRDKFRPKRNNALWVAEELGIKLHIVDVIEEYKDVVINPKYGYGANLNPCLDCKGFMVRKAREWMEANQFDFIITGEVLGQRPMSQTSRRMPIVVRDSGAFDRLLRPLSARVLEPTLPENEGWVDRSKLGDITGRSRKQQMAMASGMGIEDYAQPAGGCCFLTNPEYSRKLKDLWESRGEKQYELDDIMLLKVGRHLRPAPSFKLIVCRDEGESNFVRGYRNRFTYMETISHGGPAALLHGQDGEENRTLAARIIARYSQGRDAEEVEVEISLLDRDPYRVIVKPLRPDEIPASWFI